MGVRYGKPLPAHAPFPYEYKNAGHARGSFACVGKVMARGGGGVNRVGEEISQQSGLTQ